MVGANSSLSQQCGPCDFPFLCADISCAVDFQGCDFMIKGHTLKCRKGTMHADLMSEKVFHEEALVSLAMTVFVGIWYKVYFRENAYEHTS